MSREPDFLVDFGGKGQIVLHTGRVTPPIVVTTVCGSGIVKLEERARVPVRDVLSEESLRSLDLVVLNSHEEHAITLVIDPACFLLSLISPKVTVVTPVSLVAFSAPRVSDLDETFSSGQLDDAKDAISMVVGKATSSLVVVARTISTHLDDIIVLVVGRELFPELISSLILVA